jgi:hypothetical protein
MSFAQFFMIMAKIMLTLAMLIFQMDLTISLFIKQTKNWAFLGFKSFLTFIK